MPSSLQDEAAQIAYQRFLASLQESYPVVRVARVRCPSCRAIAQGRPQHSERDGDMSVQRRKCHCCGVMYIAIVD
jgi:hypothetical protein